QLHHHRALPSSLLSYTTLFRSAEDEVVPGANDRRAERDGERAVTREPIGEVLVVDRGEAPHDEAIAEDAADHDAPEVEQDDGAADRKCTRLNSSHVKTSYAVIC